jgi:hypothetical protein
MAQAVARRRAHLQNQRVGCMCGQVTGSARSCVRHCSSNRCHRRFVIGGPLLHLHWHSAAAWLEVHTGSVARGLAMLLQMQQCQVNAGTNHWASWFWFVL